MPEQILPPSPPITGVNGVYVPGALVYYYRNGTDTLLSVFSDEAGLLPLTNPVVADSNGRIPQVFADPSEVVRITVHSAADVLLYELTEAPFALTSLANATDVAHTPTALNTGTTVAEAIANSDARAETKAPKNSPVFTGTITGAAQNLTGLLTGVAATFSGLLTAASATITGALTSSEINVVDATQPRIDIQDTGGVLGGSVTAIVNFFANANRHGWIGFDTTTGLMSVFNDDGPIRIGNGSADSVQLRPNNVTRVSATDTGVNLVGEVTMTGDLQVDGAMQKLDLNQVWTTVTGSRAHGTTYVNSTGKPIKVSANVTMSGGVSASWQVSEDGSTWITVGASSNSGFTYQGIYFEVPAGHSYRVSGGTGSATIGRWTELR